MLNRASWYPSACEVARASGREPGLEQALGVMDLVFRLVVDRVAGFGKGLQLAQFDGAGGIQQHPLIHLESGGSRGARRQDFTLGRPTDSSYSVSGSTVKLGPCRRRIPGIPGMSRQVDDRSVVGVADVDVGPGLSPAFSWVNGTSGARVRLSLTSGMRLVDDQHRIHHQDSRYPRERRVRSGPAPGVQAADRHQQDQETPANVSRILHF